MSASQHDGTAEFVRAMGPVARALLGEPNASLSTKQELRWGNRGSFSVRLDKGTWFDNEAGEGGGVLDLVQQQRRVDKPAALDWLREQGHLATAEMATSTRGEIVATYDYRDERGELLFQVCRFDPKDFRQRRPDASKLDGWNWSTKGVRRVLFRLPQILEAVAAGRTIYVVEGEKAALALEAIGLDATCSPGGAGKWHAEIGRPLAGADVVVLPDCDPQATNRDGSLRWHEDGRPVLPGQDHADDVARQLTGVAKRVRVLMLPGLPEKGDVVDWLAAGGRAVLLDELADDLLLDQPQAEAVPVADAAIAEYFSAEAWVKRQFPPSVKLLGDLLTTTSRAFFVGATGLGKTMFGVALGAGMASGKGFLDWRCDRPVRVLYVDGEMPGELVRARLLDAMRRLGRSDLQGNLFVYCTDTAEVSAKLFPKIGRMEPLNTEAGQNFIYGFIQAIGGVDVVIFDNVMSLVSGDQKDEVPWTETLPLVAGLTSRQIGQVWLDHAGHNTGRQYGSSTKAWRFDAVGIMTAIPDDERADRETGFKLSFDTPGKARRRTPDNWHEFAPRVIRLADDVWSSEHANASDRPTRKAGLGKVSPSRAVYHTALLDALITNSVRPGTTTLATWEAECVRRGLVDAPNAGEDSASKRARTASFRAARSHLAAAGWVGIDGDHVSDLARDYDRFGGLQQ